MLINWGQDDVANRPNGLLDPSREGSACKSVVCQYQFTDPQEAGSDLSADMHRVDVQGERCRYFEYAVDALQYAQDALKYHGMALIYPIHAKEGVFYLVRGFHDNCHLAELEQMYMNAFRKRFTTEWNGCDHI